MYTCATHTNLDGRLQPDMMEPTVPTTQGNRLKLGIDSRETRQQCGSASKGNREGEETVSLILS